MKQKKTSTTGSYIEKALITLVYYIIFLYGAIGLVWEMLDGKSMINIEAMGSLWFLIVSLGLLLWDRYRFNGKALMIFSGAVVLGVISLLGIEGLNIGGAKSIYFYGRDLLSVDQFLVWLFLWADLVVIMHLMLSQYIDKHEREVEERGTYWDFRRDWQSYWFFFSVWSVSVVMTLTMRSYIIEAAVMDWIRINIMFGIGFGIYSSVILINTMKRWKFK